MPTLDQSRHSRNEAREGGLLSGFCASRPKALSINFQSTLSNLPFSVDPALFKASPLCPSPPSTSSSSLSSHHHHVIASTHSTYRACVCVTMYTCVYTFCHGGRGGTGGPPGHPLAMLSHPFHDLSLSYLSWQRAVVPHRLSCHHKKRRKQAAGDRSIVAWHNQLSADDQRTTRPTDG